MELLEKVTVWYSVENGGDGSAYPQWYLTESETQFLQETAYEGWGEECNGSIETFVGSDVHKQAVKNSADLQEERGEEFMEWLNDDYLGE